MRLLVLIAALAAIIVTPLSGSAADQPPYTINVMLGLTGPAAFQGQSEWKALQLVEAVANRQGGIRGRPVKFVVSDDQGSPQTTVQLITRMAADKVPIVIGPQLSGTCGATIPIITQSNGPVMYCLSPGIRPNPGSFAFASGPNVDDAMLVLIRYFRERGLTRIAAIVSTDGSGQSYELGVNYAMGLPENRNVQMVALEHMNPGDISVSAQIARIKAANPQAILTLATGTPWGTIMRGVAESGLGVPVGAGHGNTAYSILEQYRSFLPPEVYFPGLVSLVANSVGRGAIQNAQNLYFSTMKNAGMKSDIAAIQAWEPAMMLIDAVRKLGTDATATQVRDYLVSLHGWVGINGVYDFRDGSQRGIGQLAIMIDRWDTAKSDFTPVGKPGGYLR
jgi:branched-chain amino acid transport system substrate-binding protein